jgi:sugar lactone lactonase YvrE
MLRRFVRSHPFAVVGTLAGAGAVIGATADSRLDPAAWHPPEPPELTGVFAANLELTHAETVIRAVGPEDVAFDDAGRLYTGSEDGTVRRTVEPVTPETTDADLEAFAHTGGRPLALAFDGDELFVCTAGVGLVRVDSRGNAGVVADRAGGRPIAFADDLHITDDTIYFTDATEHAAFIDELLELRDTGRLLAYDRETGETSVELSELGFANGVAPGPDGDSLLVTETSRYRIRRYWHRGDRAGEDEVIASNLPGFPDNIDATAGDADRGGYWVAIPTHRDATLDRIHEFPGLIRQLGKLPPAVLDVAATGSYGLLLRVDAEGEIVESLHDPTGRVFGITSATPHEGALYLGTLFGERVVRYTLA